MNYFPYLALLAAMVPGFALVILALTLWRQRGPELREFRNWKSLGGSVTDSGKGLYTEVVARLDELRGERDDARAEASQFDVMRLAALDEISMLKLSRTAALNKMHASRDRLRDANKTIAELRKVKTLSIPPGGGASTPFPHPALEPLIWTTGDNSRIPVPQLDDSHLCCILHDHAKGHWPSGAACHIGEAMLAALYAEARARDMSFEVRHPATL